MNTVVKVKSKQKKEQEEEEEGRLGRKNKLKFYKNNISNIQSLFCFFSPSALRGSSQTVSKERKPCLEHPIKS